ncbi:HD domain-containing protein [Ornithinimicrobium sp. F0845]|uniref:HD domain-containing phosphohydrolase n=1 Tax=Ornithinimicrobium sp. F0845 TaxID=2926412 RepID=UPI001FF18EDF|nr:HD domain-containing phosphohydrolase [Ornithinimicrobium sp. F0845]MCK0110584.1 HD domain-containing protein [Ornithinimicrobium sp. F0845]
MPGETLVRTGPLCHRGEVFRLLGLLGALSLGTDLGSGSPLDESLRRSVVATRFATALGCPGDQVSDVLYASLLQHLGCTAYAHENGQRWGDDTAFVRLAFGTDFSDNRDVWRTFVTGLAESSGRSRVGVLATTLTTARKDATLGPTATCEVTRQAAGRLGLSDTVQVALVHALAQWDGRGYPDVRGEQIPRATRLVHVASVAVQTDAEAGRDAVVPELRRRSGTVLDPALVHVFVERAGDLMDTGDADPFDLALQSEPDPVRWVDVPGVREVSRTFGDLADLKSPWFQGHSGAVGELAASAAAGLGLGEAEVETVRVAGYLHDLGRIGTPSSIWDKPGTLTRSELEQTRLHPQLSERILSRVPALAEAGALAGQHHERLDGSGYFRGLGGAHLSVASRVLATADAYRRLVEDRAHRPGTAPARAAERLRAEARAGALDGDVVEAVLHAAGHGTASRGARPAGLTARQVEVLRLVAAGQSNRQIARSLSISPRTAEHHVQDTYLKIGCSTRAGAALFAMEHGLLKDG